MHNNKFRTAVLSIALLAAGVAIGAAIALCLQKNAPPTGDAPVSIAATAQSASATAAEDTAHTAAAPMFGSPVKAPALPAVFPPAQTPPAWVSKAGALHQVPVGRDLQWSQTTSGYTICVGRRAVDSEQPADSEAMQLPTVIDENGSVLVTDPTQPIGRNGLRGNPCVDPPSSHGASYSRAY